MYLELSFVSTGDSVESVQITLGEKNSPFVSCIIDKAAIELIRGFFDDPQQTECKEPSKHLIIEDNTNLRILAGESGTILDQLVASVEKGLESHAPEICEEGVNGTYFVKDEEGQTIAIFKPEDEEGDSASNPKFSAGEGSSDLSKGLKQGEGVLREVAAYMLDHSHFSGVPPTCLVQWNQFRDHETVQGSLQQFVSNDGPSWDVGPAPFPIQEVHKIGILDLRIFNADRHGGNILMRKNSDGLYSLIPIDHGFSLTDQLDKAWFDWMSFPQTKTAFNQESLDYIAALDVEEDALILSNLGIRRECIRTMKVSTTLLKKGAAAGLSLYEIGSLATRMIYGQASPLENLFEQSLADTSLQLAQLVEPSLETVFLNRLYHLMDLILSQH
eukprot:TRINITY_DN3844_c0_g1_i1.p1 TRINITY_DN3844_c0_g1~~TRINITY_DN3844_c0_g1_i1.p1  ORF type:complete len:387 (-),score=43.51 TRINITY_DN3844_c0_g1_i1:61-1221(-)